MTKETLASLEIELDTLKKELNTDYKVTTTFSVWLRNRLISAGLELVLSYRKKSKIASYYRQFSTNINGGVCPFYT